MTPKLNLSHLPTPLWHHAELDRLVGAEVWVKRDDMTSGAAAGNKIRKLEYLLAQALERRATALITCGGVQSNHARATALLGAELGLKTYLLLRSEATDEHPKTAGNLLLDRLAGADIRLISAAQYQQRDELMRELQAELARTNTSAYVIPEGGSNGLGALGYVDAMAEIRQQLDTGIGPGRGVEFDAVIHACGSGGTAAGVALGIGKWGVARRAIAFAVCDNTRYFTTRIEAVIAEAQAREPSLVKVGSWSVEDSYKGPAYGFASLEQRRFMLEVCRKTGLVLDPVYTGKALFGLAKLEPKPNRVLFLHTGGLPGLLAEGVALDEALGEAGG